MTSALLDWWTTSVRQLPLGPVVFGTAAIPYIITYLSFDPSSRWLRMVLWPVSLLCYASAVGRLGDARESARDLL